MGDDAHLAQMVTWLEARPGDGWFYVSGANFHFGSQADAAAFRRWVTAAAA